MSIVADTSAFVAILQQETDSDIYRNALLEAKKVFISTATAVELHIVVTAKLGAEGRILRLSRLLEQPLLALWGDQGVVHRCFRPLTEWRRIAREVSGEALPCGHYIPEEAPERLLEHVVPFLSGVTQ